jgi:hypothetical protein
LSERKIATINFLQIAVDFFQTKDACGQIAQLELEQQSTIFSARDQINKDRKARYTLLLWKLAM